VREGAVARTFDVTLAPPGAAPDAPPTAATPAASPPAPAPTALTPVHSPFGGQVEVLKIHVREGDAVHAGQVVATVEAMKAEHDVRSPVAGSVARVDARPGDEVGAATPIVTIGG
jgi:biotin carboxyl carrier protein